MGESTLKVTFVTPRYATEVVGGAEYAARMLAERLVSQLGYDVSVFTSCALDMNTWANELPAGKQDVNGVTVERFPTTQPRDANFLHTSMRVHSRPALAQRALQEQWIDEQGPLAPGILDALSASDADVVVFYPYLYYPTVRGIPLVADRAVLHPAAHDEASIRMSIFAEVFGMASGLVFQTDAERRLTESLFPIAHHPQLLLGLGVDPQDGDEPGFRDAFDVGDRPYVLCVGRVDAGKGTTLLARYFTEYKRRNPGPLALVLAGAVKDEVPKSQDVIVTGLISDEHKWGALRGSQLLISPSPFEAFSLALVEGWAAGKPVMVNASCIATREHVERSQGGLWFDSYATFESALDKLLDDALAKQFAASGKSYVDERFRWPVLIDRYGKFLTRVAERAQMKVAS